MQMDSRPAGTVTEGQRVTPLKTPLGMDWLVYLGIVICSLTQALLGYQPMTPDAVVYLDIADAIRDHRWHSVFNAYWFPLYPALLAAGKACFGNRIQYELMATRLVGFLISLLFVLSSIALASSARRIMLVRGANPDELLPQRTLYVWVAVFAFFFYFPEMAWYTPDALVSSFMILAVAALLLGVTKDSLLPYVAAGVFGGLAFWAKAFAFPFFFLLMLLTAVANFRRFRVLRRLVLCLLVFALVAGPYIWQISAAKARFTFGDSGRLTSAWLVNGADQFNPVADPTVFVHGTANVNFRHPAELLSKTPEIGYYSRSQADGSTPQWDDPSYWSDGLTPRFVVSQEVAALKRNLPTAAGVPLRLPIILLLGVLCLFGFTVRKASQADPMLTMVLVLALFSIGSYALIFLCGRYVAFSFVMIGTLYAACSLTKHSGRKPAFLHKTVLLASALVLLFAFRYSLVLWNLERQRLGAHPLEDIYDPLAVSAGSDLALLYPQGSEVACMGYRACIRDPYWARYAGLSVTAVIEVGHGSTETGLQSVESVRRVAAEGCKELEQNPEVLDALRKRHIRAIVSSFDASPPCSASWRPVGESAAFYLLPL